MTNVTPSSFLKPFMLNQFKSHQALEVRKLSRLFIEEGGKTRPAETGHYLAVYSLVGVGVKKSPI